MVLHKVGQALTRFLEALAAIAVVFIAAWLVVKGAWWVGRQVVRHWRTSGTVAAVAVWCYWLGWLSLVITLVVVAVGLLAWRWAGREVFEAWAGRHLRAWRQRWIFYAPRLPRWLRACGLTVPDHDPGIAVQVNPFRRSAVRPKRRPRPDQVPRIVGVRSGGSWARCACDWSRGRRWRTSTSPPAPGGRPERRACQVRELGPQLVSIDFQRRNLLAALAAVPGEEVDLRRVWSGRTEYGTDWLQSLRGGHTLTAGATGAGKNSYGWQPLVAIAPAHPRRSDAGAGGSSTATPSPPRTRSRCSTT